MRKDESSVHVPREDSGHRERMRSDDGPDFGSCQVGVCRAVGTTPLGTECAAGVDLTVLDIKEVYHLRN